MIYDNILMLNEESKGDIQHLKARVRLDCVWLRNGMFIERSNLIIMFLINEFELIEIHENRQLIKFKHFTPF